MSVIKLRGLPWSCTVEDIEHFLGDDVHVAKVKCEEDESGGDATCSTTMKPSIYLTTTSTGRPSGEAFVELVDEADVEAAMKRNNAMMGQRYIEIFRSSAEQMQRITTESSQSASKWQDPVVRLRGLPYGCSKKDVHDFFSGLSIAYDGILLVVDFSGRFNGEAFVHFSTMTDASKALEKHKQKMGNRYLEIFRSSLAEMRHYAGEDTTYDDDSGYNNNYGGDMAGGYSNGGGKMSNKRGMKRGSGGGGGSDGGMDNRSRPYPNMRNGAPNRGGGAAAGLPSLMSSFNDGPVGFGRGGMVSPSNMMNSYFDDAPAPLFNSSALMRFGGGSGSGQSNKDNYESYQRSEYRLKMRGLPFTARQNDIFEFFSPLKPIEVEFLRGRDSRPSGECEVEFGSQEELDEAMTYDKKYMGNRYIELFPVSSATNNGAKSSRFGGGGGDSNGSGDIGVGVSNSIPSLFAATIPLASVDDGSVATMTTAYPHQQMAAAMGNMLMANMAKKMFQNALGQYQNQFAAQQQQQQFHSPRNNRHNSRRF